MASRIPPFSSWLYGHKMKEGLFGTKRAFSGGRQADHTVVKTVRLITRGGNAFFSISHTLATVTDVESGTASVRKLWLVSDR